MNIVRTDDRFRVGETQEVIVIDTGLDNNKVSVDPSPLDLSSSASMYTVSPERRKDADAIDETLMAYKDIEAVMAA